MMIQAQRKLWTVHAYDAILTWKDKKVKIKDFSLNLTNTCTINRTLTVEPLVSFHVGVLVAGTQQFLLVLLHQTVKTVAIAAFDPPFCHLTFLKKRKKKQKKEDSCERNTKLESRLDGEISVQIKTKKPAAYYLFHKQTEVFILLKSLKKEQQQNRRGMWRRILKTNKI